MSIYLAVLHESIVYHARRSDTIVIVRIVHPIDRHSARASAKVILEVNACLARELTIILFVGNCLYYIYSQLRHHLVVSLSAIHRQFPSLHSSSFHSFITSFPRLPSCSLAQTNDAIDPNA